MNYIPRYLNEVNGKVVYHGKDFSEQPRYGEYLVDELREVNTSGMRLPPKSSEEFFEALFRIEENKGEPIFVLCNGAPGYKIFTGVLKPLKRTGA